MRECALGRARAFQGPLGVLIPIIDLDVGSWYSPISRLVPADLGQEEAVRLG